jgi:hypothetical protein
MNYLYELRMRLTLTRVNFPDVLLCSGKVLRCLLDKRMIVAGKCLRTYLHRSFENATK